jgi:hypothetical protein
VLLVSLIVALQGEADIQFLVVSKSLQGEAGIVLESPDQKTRGFMVQIVLPR